MKTVEFFGLPCSGKTFIATILRNRINKSCKISHTYQSAFFEYIFNEEKITFIEYLSLKYFRYFKNKNKKLFFSSNKKKNSYKKKKLYRNPVSDFFYKNYINICTKYAKKKDNNLKKIIFREIDNNHLLINNAKRNAKLWFIEFFAYEYIVEKYNYKIDFLIDDEALYQKMFIFSNLMANDRFLNKYVKILNKPSFLILVESSTNKIISRSKKRVGTSKFNYQNFAHLTNMIKYKNKIKKVINKKTKLITFKNNHNYLKLINNIYATITK